MKQRTLAVALAAMTVAATQTGCSHAETANKASNGGGPVPTVRFVKNPAPVSDVTVTDLDGRTFTLSSLRGKVALVNFWATWCGPCRAEIPELIKLQDSYRDNLVILGIATDDPSVDRVRMFARENGMNYPIVMATDETRRAFPSVSALPTTFVIDPQGRVVQKHIGLIDIKIYENETRALAGLVKANIEEFEDNGRVSPTSATEIPGVDLDALDADTKKAVLQKLNSEMCTCGCNLTLAQCRVNDTDCTVSLPLAQEIAKDAKKAKDAKDAKGPR